MLHLLQKQKAFEQGSIALYILLAVVIIAAVFIANGAFPISPISPALHLSENLPPGVLSTTPPSTVYDIVTNTPIPGAPDDKKLQLLGLKGIPRIKSCTTDVAVYFIIDISGSMNEGTKLAGLKSALQTFAANYTDTGIIGLEEFGTEASLTIPITTYSAAKAQFLDIATNLTISENSTSTRKAFQLAKDTLSSPLYGMNQYPGKKFNVVFISDGIPESQLTVAQCENLFTGTIQPACSNLCAIDSISQKYRCFAADQDPTGQTSNPPLEDLAGDIKGMGVKIFSIAYPDTGNPLFQTKQQTMMTAIASTDSTQPSGKDYFPAPDPSQLSGIMSNIITKICP